MKVIYRGNLKIKTNECFMSEVEAETGMSNFNGFDGMISGMIGGKYTTGPYGRYIGNHSLRNKIQGPGIQIGGIGQILIGYWNEDIEAPGNFIRIFRDG